LAGHVACTEASRNAASILVGSLEGKRPLGIHVDMQNECNFV